MLKERFVSHINRNMMMGVVAHAFNPNTWEAETGGFLSSRGQPGLQSEFQDSQSYTEKPWLEKPKPSNQPTKQTNKTHGKQF
jgi:hypothetical protein